MGVVCPYCQEQAVLSTGDAVYPHRPDLWGQKFWHCRPCDAYVGCHRAGGEYGDGTQPLGTMAKRELRSARKRAHAAFDPLWRDKHMPRSKAYAWLARALGIPKRACHIALFDEQQCARVVELVRARRA